MVVVFGTDSFNAMDFDGEKETFGVPAFFTSFILRVSMVG